MGSVAQDIKIVSHEGEILPESAIKELKSAVKCEVLFKGEASEEAYLAAIDRFNKGGIQEAVSLICDCLGSMLTRLVDRSVLRVRGRCRCLPQVYSEMGPRDGHCLRSTQLLRGIIDDRIGNW